MTFDLQNYTYNGYQVIMEFWEPITDEMVPNIKPIYFISSIGNIYNSKTNRYSNITIVPGRYPSVTLQLNNNTAISMDIHRLVCMAFHGMPPEADYEVDHINCDKTCAFEGNLEWVTRQENHNRACINNLIKSGEDNYRSILTNDDIEYLCSLLIQHLPINDICNIMENRILPRVYPSGFKGLISHILQKDVWKNIVCKYNFPDYSTNNFSDKEIHTICQYLELGIRYDEILNILGKSDCDDSEKHRLKETIYNIKAGKIYTDISSNYDIINNKSYILTNEEIDFICKNIAYGIRPIDIINSLGTKGSEKSVRKAIYDISRGACHKKEVAYYKSLIAQSSTTIEKDSNIELTE